MDERHPTWRRAKVGKRKLTFYWLICNVGSCLLLDVHVETLRWGTGGECKRNLTHEELIHASSTRIESLFLLFIDSGSKRKNGNFFFEHTRSCKMLLSRGLEMWRRRQGAALRKSRIYRTYDLEDPAEWDEGKAEKKLNWKEITSKCRRESQLSANGIRNEKKDEHGNGCGGG